MQVEFSLLERNRIANNLFGGANFVIKAYSNQISATGANGVELSNAGYSAIAVANNTTNFPLATNGTRSNSVAFERAFTESAAIASVGIFAENGDFLARRIYDQPLSVEAGQNWRFPVGSFSFTPSNS